MPDTLEEDDWQNLLMRISEKECTPFVGAGASAGTLLPAKDIATSWAKEYGYPLSDSDNLARVAQFLAVAHDPMFPKELIRRDFQSKTGPDFTDPDEPHRLLADLALPLYITTNYDNFMFKALQARRAPADPLRELCRWNKLIEMKAPPRIDSTKLTSARPLVYHLHGYCDIPQSIVLTEDDYLEFLVRISRDNEEPLLPPTVRTALATTSLLFVGYSLADWDFRVLFRGLIGSLGSTLGMTSIAVQLKPTVSGSSAEEAQRAQQYLAQYFEKIQTVKVRVYWGLATEFAHEFRQRWEAFQNATVPK